jgi:hypothetical protein
MIIHSRTLYLPSSHYTDNTFNETGSGGGRGAGASARKCPSLINIYNFNKNN